MIRLRPNQTIHRPGKTYITNNEKLKNFYTKQNLPELCEEIIITLCTVLWLLINNIHCIIHNALHIHKVELIYCNRPRHENLLTARDCETKSYQRCLSRSETTLRRSPPRDKWRLRLSLIGWLISRRDVTASMTRQSQISIIDKFIKLLLKMLLILTHNSRIKRIRVNK